MTDRDYMQRAIELARRGEGWVNPNPLVGAVIVKDGRVIAEGWHHKYGELHAERDAFRALKEPAEGATIYVTLEPCCHYGKQPPCTLAIIEHGISRVVIGSRDPNPLVAGKGVRMLREHGITVVEDFMREECDALNPIFFHYITTGRPYVKMKYAMTADGKIATKTGASKWITSEEARGLVHDWRNACRGIMAGIGTVLADDPLLNCRKPGGRDPVRIICDSHLRIPEDAQIVKTAAEYETIVACAVPEAEGIDTKAQDIDQEDREAKLNENRLQDKRVNAERLPQEDIQAEAESLRQEDMRVNAESLQQQDIRAKAERLRRQGIEVWSVPAQNGTVDLQELMRRLGKRGIDSVLLEGGGTLNESALRAGIVQEVNAFVAPKIFGGQAKSPVEGTGVEEPREALQMKIRQVRQVGPDLLITYCVTDGPK